MAVRGFYGQIYKNHHGHKNSYVTAVMKFHVRHDQLVQCLKGQKGGAFTPIMAAMAMVVAFMLSVRAGYGHYGLAQPWPCKFFVSL